MNNTNKRSMENGMKESHEIHPAWLALIRHCREMGFGEIERVRIQDGVPVLVERSTQRIKLI